MLLYMSGLVIPTSIPSGVKVSIMKSKRNSVSLIRSFKKNILVYVYHLKSMITCKMLMSK